MSLNFKKIRKIFLSMLVVFCSCCVLNLVHANIYSVDDFKEKIEFSDFNGIGTDFSSVDMANTRIDSLRALRTEALPFATNLSEAMKYLNSYLRQVPKSQVVIIEVKFFCGHSKTYDELKQNFLNLIEAYMQFKDESRLPRNVNVDNY